MTRLAKNQRLLDKRMVRGSAHKDAAARQNAKRAGKPLPARLELNPSPLERDLAAWGSCDESACTEDDMDVLRGPDLDTPPADARRPLPPTEQSAGGVTASSPIIGEPAACSTTAPVVSARTGPGTDRARSSAAHQ